MIWEHAPEAAVALAAAVLVPLAVRVLDEPDRAGRRAATLVVARELAPPAGLLAAASFLLPAGPAVLAAAPYLALTLLLALHGLARLARGGPPSEIALGAACVYLFGAAIWLFAHRLGHALLGYPPYWVALTATHFHIAGFILPLTAGLLSRRGGPLSTLAVWLVLLGVPATAFTMYAAPGLEPYAAVAMATGAALVGLLLTVPRTMCHAQCATHNVPRTLRIVGGIAVIAAMPMAVGYAFRVGWRIGELDPLATMAATHGVLNLVFAVAAIAAWTMARPAPDWVRGVPLSRITGRGRIGGEYFEREGIAKGSARGTCDRLEEFEHPGFRASGAAPAIRAFYERLDQHRVRVAPRWRGGFRTGARIWRALALRLGQLALPIEAGAIRSRLVGLDAARDGRTAPRAWIREDAAGRAMFVSAYAVHRHDGVGYMNVAFPLPGMQMTSINRFESLPGGAVRVTSAKDGPGSDCGCWLVIGSRRGVAIRLPVSEEVQLWPPGAPGLPADLAVPSDATVVGRQHMRLAGIRFLTIDYAIAREPDEAGVDVAGDPAAPQA